MIALLALAASLPTFDPPTYCATIGDVVPGHSYVIEQQCLAQEQAALGRLEAQDIPLEVNRWCTAVASANALGSYAIMAECVREELWARSRR